MTDAIFCYYLIEYFNNFVRNLTNLLEALLINNYGWLANYVMLYVLCALVT